jgi:sulfur carrier protein
VNISLNGRPHELDGPCSVGEIVDGQVADRRGVAVAVDGEVLPRTAWDTTMVYEDARLEIVGAVQGG